MRPEAAAYLATAHENLREAGLIVAIPLARVGARSAYYAMFHAAEAFIFERTGKVAKTHSGVRSEFSRLMICATGADIALGRTLVKGYGYKDLADYGIDPTQMITDADAGALLADASRFVARVAELLSEPSPDAG